MSEPIRDFPFAYRLPPDIAARIHGTAARAGSSTRSAT